MDDDEPVKQNAFGAEANDSKEEERINSTFGAAEEMIEDFESKVSENM